MNQAGRRAAREGKDAIGVRETRRAPFSGFEMREVPNGTGGTNLKFEGYASVTCADENDFSHAYDMEDYIGAYQESVLRGAFAKTLAEGADVAFLVNHGGGGGVTMARTKPGTLQLLENHVGLHVAATLNPTRSDVQLLKAAVDDGAIDEMSFAFRVMRQKWSYKEDNGEIDRRFLQELNLDKGDVSPVNFGANDHTSGLLTMRNRRLARSERPISPLVLPDYTMQSRLRLARLRSGPQPKPRAGYVPDTTSETRRKLARLRGR